MIYSDTATERLVNMARRSGPSPIVRWLKAAWLQIGPASAKAPPTRDRVREAAKLRTWATDVQRSDPRFAEDLFAAADRHEAMAT